MIVYYGGASGSGKSYSVVGDVIIPALSSGRKVITNIPLTDEVASLPGQVVYFPIGATMLDVAGFLIEGKDSSGEYIINRENAGAVYVIDEFSKFCPSGIRQNSIPEKVNAFFTMYRHISSSGNFTEIHLLSQHPSQICNSVKVLIHSSYDFTKTVVAGKLVSTKKTYTKCYTTKNAVFVKTEYGTYKPDIWKYYKSQCMSEDGGFTSETPVNNPVDLLRTKAKYLIPAAIVFPIAIYFAATTLLDMFSFFFDDPLSNPVVNESKTVSSSSSDSKDSSKPLTSALYSRDYYGSDYLVSTGYARGFLSILGQVGDYLIIGNCDNQFLVKSSFDWNSDNFLVYKGRKIFKSSSSGLCKDVNESDKDSVQDKVASNLNPF